MIELPPAAKRGAVTVEEALLERRSVRSYARRALTLAEVSQVLWAAQGITTRHGDRTTPSAGALFPLELYLVAGRIEDLSPGVYRYRPRGHGLVEHLATDVRPALAEASCRQSWIRAAPAHVVFTAVYERTRSGYGERAVRYVDMEVGGAAQNVHLQAVALGLGAVVVGAFDDQRVKEILELPPEEDPLAIMPVGATP